MARRKSAPAPRKPTVLTQKLVKAEKITERPERVVTGWRWRQTTPGWTGALERPFYGTEDQVRERADADREMGADGKIEQCVGPCWVTPMRDVPTVADLAHEGMAHQTEDGRAWRITPLGQAVLADALMGLE